jgi:hypothetical protein
MIQHPNMITGVQMISIKAYRHVNILVIALLVLIGGFSWGYDVRASVLKGEQDFSRVNIAPALLNSDTVFPAYDSGWFDLGPRPDPLPVDFTHNLGGNPDDYLVSLMCQDDTSLGTYECTDFGFNPNALWYALTDTSISVWVSSGLPDAIRVLIYTVSPAYDSGWLPLLARPDPIPVLFDHNLGGNLDNYLVSLECRDETSLATYNCTDFNFNINADWYGLTDTSVTVWVDNGPRPDEIRIRILEDPPDYDSGWIGLAIRPDPLPVSLDHNLGGDPDEYFINLICRDDTSLATYSCTNFFFNRTAGWYDLNSASIDVWVAGGSLPDDVRIRIWAPDHIYLPIILKN